MYLLSQNLFYFSSPGTKVLPALSFVPGARVGLRTTQEQSAAVMSGRKSRHFGPGTSQRILSSFSLTKTPFSQRVRVSPAVCSLLYHLPVSWPFLCKDCFGNLWKLIHCFSEHYFSNHRIKHNGLQRQSKILKCNYQGVFKVWYRNLCASLLMY